MPLLHVATRTLITYIRVIEFNGRWSTDTCASSVTVSHNFYGKIPELCGRHQVDLLQNVRAYFGSCVNGKATLTGEEESLPEEKRLDRFHCTYFGLQYRCRFHHSSEF